MKKLLGILAIITFFITAAFASSYEQTAAHKVYRVAEKEVTHQALGQKLLAAAKKGQMKVFRTILTGADKSVLLTTDDYGNNVLHVARNKQIFDLAWNMLDAYSREILLTQRNKSGETPLMTHIVYGHENIFLTYFPQTELYSRLQKTTSALKMEGLAQRGAEIEREELIKQCSMGGITMWQRAHALAVGAYADSYAANSRGTMAQVEEMIASVAPFLVK